MMPIITISRGTFSGGRKIAECAAEKLGYRCISREVIVEAATEYGVSEDKLLEALTKKPGVVERLTWERNRYLAYIRAALVREAREENVVYHGNAGHLLLKDVPHVLKVRIIANMEFRTAAAVERENLSREEAVRFIARVDEGRAKWTRFLYGVDWNDPSLYDIVVHLDHVGLDGACDVICHMAGMDGYKPSALSRGIIDDLVLSTHLRALIAADKSISDRQVDVRAEGGIVTVTGTVESIWEADKIRTMARSTPGVKDVVSELRARLPVWAVSAA
jgi:cytidylate kinase